MSAIIVLALLAGMRTSYFSAHEVDYIGSFSADALVADISEGSVIVFTVWGSFGWHTMTALYTDNQYIVYNRYNDVSVPETYTSLSENFGNGGWIYGIKIET